MAETETGWTKEWPSTDSVYWYRLDAASIADVVEVRHGDVYYTGDGVGVSVRNHDGGEWLGPISPSDTEQLMELRRVGTETLKVLEHYKERHLVPPYFSGALADLRDALAGVDRVATVQCADCLTWFDKNANHTCRQQVRRNQRGAK